MKPFIAYRVALLMCILLANSSCKKFLSEKPDASQVIPDNLGMVEGLLYHIKMTEWYPLVDELVSDNLSYNTAPGLKTFNGQCYTWDAAIVVDNVWKNLYDIIATCNRAIGLAKQVAGSDADRRRIIGEALFFRAHAYYLLSQLFVPPYHEPTINTFYGVPLLISPDVNDILAMKRSTINQTYMQVVNDLEGSFPLLPDVPEFKTMPGKAAALGLLARTWLIMRNYDTAFYYTDLALQQQGGSLLDYNDSLLPSHAGSSFMRFNREVVFHVTNLSNPGFNREGRVDTDLYQLYDTNDLRRKLFFQPDVQKFRGSYSGNTTLLFFGVTVSELYLIRAECNARRGFYQASMADVNALLLKRWVRGTFHEYHATNASAALAIVLEERRKELVFRGLRFSDLKRLNLDSSTARTLKRSVNGVDYTLLPNDLRYTFLIPESVIEQSGMAQNPR